MKKKRLIAALIAAVALSAGAFALAGCNPSDGGTSGETNNTEQNGSQGGNIDDPATDKDGSHTSSTESCSHKNLVEISDQGGVCQSAYVLHVYVCGDILQNDYGFRKKGEICGQIFESTDHAKKNISLGRLVNTVYSQEEFEDLCKNLNNFSRYRKPSEAGHVPVIDPAVPATCKDKGLTEGSHCEICNTVLKAQEEIDTTDHNYTDTITFQEAHASPAHTCSFCGKEENTDIFYSFKLNDNEQSYAVETIHCEDFGNGAVTIPDSYNGLPVTVVKANYDFVSIFGSNSKNITSVSIPDTVTSIGSDAFRLCSFSEIELPETLTYIGYSAFAGCSKLTEISIPYGVSMIDLNTFGDCRALKEVTIPNSVTTIKYGAFYNCIELMEITIPHSVTKIDNYSDAGGLHPIFKNCKKLKKVYWNTESSADNTFNDESINGISLIIGEGVTSIGRRAFSQSIALSSISIPDGVTSIGDSAFEDCSGLTSIPIPDSVTSIGEYVFDGCSGLSINYNGTKAKWKAISKDYYWNFGIGSNFGTVDLTVQCTDGKLDKDGNVISE